MVKIDSTPTDMGVNLNKALGGHLGGIANGSVCLIKHDSNITIW